MAASVGRREYLGIGASAGEAAGRIFCPDCHTLPHPVRDETHGNSDPDAEREGLASACRSAAQELERLAGEVRSRAGDAAEIFEIHRMMTEDGDLLEAAERHIAAGETAAAAIIAAGEELSAEMAALGDEYLGARDADIKDVAQRIARHASGGGAVTAEIPMGALILAREFSPGDTAALDPTRVRGLATIGGSPTSHTAILARQFGLPAVVRLHGIDDGVLSALDGREAIIDGRGGRLLIEPTLPELEELASRMARERERQAAQRAAAALPAVTRSGRRVTVMANIGSPAEAATAAELGAEGIGLFRSEFLYLGRAEPPSEEEQTAAYRQVLRAIPRGQVIIRTLDIGADKQEGGATAEIGENPALGVRGIRWCLEAANLSLFRTQLRAICRASVGGRVALMLPMVTTPAEVRRVRELLREVQNELRFEEAEFDPEMPLGIMIETPAAALMADELCRICDFFSVGTNDLCQYTLAADRQSAALLELVREGIPAVLRLIGGVCSAVRRARESGEGRVRWVGVCGELAADPEICADLVRLGADEVSLPPPSIPEIKAAIREME